MRASGVSLSPRSAPRSGRYRFKELVGSIIIRRLNLAKLFTSYSHHCPSRPASGLRLGTVVKSDKEKSELYFATMVKKNLD
jgi:hypothetical protein